jgi:DNA-binding CsgD family transcriptional regulator
MVRGHLDLETLISSTGSALARAPVTGQWEAALTGVAEAVGGWGCHLNSMSKRRGVTASFSGGIPCDLISKFVRQGGADPEINRRAAAIYAAQAMQVCSENDFTSEDEWRTDPFYSEFLSKADAPFSVFGKLFENHDESAAVTVLRSAKQGHATWRQKSLLSHMLPQILSALKMQELLDRNAVSLAVKTLELVNAAAFICDSSLKIASLTMNAEAEIRNAAYLGTRNDRLRLKDYFSQDDLASAVVKATGVAQARACANLAVLRKDRRYVRTLSVAPYSGDEGRFYRPKAILILHEDERPVMRAEGKPEPGSLTQAEREIGRLLLIGQTTREIADIRQVSTSTVQTQIKAMGSKLSARHRAELLIALQKHLGAKTSAV